MNEIEIPIYFNPDNWESLEAIHGFVPLSLCNIKIVTFTKVPTAIFDDIELFKGEKTKYSQMYADGMKFSSPYSSKEILSMFNKNE